ncbi:MAG TPA: glycoside hydrolase family 130 protein [Tepidisphaeraceae bacterium]|jgi:predicted GH43/DUF377 family glycosyl hydrolase
MASLVISMALAGGVHGEWLGPFVRPAGMNPIIRPDPSASFDCPMQKRPVKWECAHAFNPAAVVKDNQVYLLYRAEDADNGIGKQTSRIGIATSKDGIHFDKQPEPVLYPANDAAKSEEWKGGCEDPRVVETDDGGYLMTYTRWNGKYARIGIATSKDLLTWQKHDSAFKTALNGKYQDHWAKSASIVCRRDGDHMIATKINGKYWMYWGESPIFAATSEDLLKWEPVEDGHGELLSIVAPRKDHFDSMLTEAGPPAVLTEKGIVLLYNGKNGADGDKTQKVGSYSAGQVLVDAHDPTHVTERLEQPFYRPTEDFERAGQYAAGTTFIEGLVHFHNKWFLYYGCADSYVAVAVAEDR